MRNPTAARLHAAWSALVVAYPENETIARVILGEEIFSALHPLMLKEIAKTKDGILGLERAVQPLRAESDAEQVARAQAELNEFFGTKPLPQSRWQQRWAAGGRLLERGEISRDEYAAVLNGDIPETIRAKLEQEMQSTPEGGSK